VTDTQVTAPPDVLSPAAPRPAPRRRWLTTLFAGDPRVWRWAAVAFVPLAAVVAVWCLVPRPYYTGTNGVNALVTNPVLARGTTACQGGLNIPPGTARVQFAIGSDELAAPRLRVVLTAGGRRQVISARGAANDGGAVERVTVPVQGFAGGRTSARLCATVTSGTFAIAGTGVVQALQPPETEGGKPTLLRMAVWYLPPTGAKRSYVSELGDMFSRAALFAPGFVKPWLFALVFFVLLPILALISVRCLALASAGRGRRLVLWLYIIAVLNAAAWSVITPPFQAPDEVDHFAYVQSLVERGARPTQYPTSPVARWSGTELAALLGSDMLTNHQGSDSRAPWLQSDVTAYRRLLATTHAKSDDGGGYQTTSSYGPLYYYAVAPGYLLASGGSAFSQLSAARLMSALIGALAAVFAFLTVRELAPRQRFAAVLAALVVAYEPMYSFISGSVNNDVGIDVGGAAVAYLLVRLIRRGPTLRLLLGLGLLLGLLPAVKTTGYELIVLAILALAGSVWHHRLRLRSAWRRWVVSIGGFFGCIAIGYEIAQRITDAVTPAAPAAGAISAATPSSAGAASGPLNVLLHYPASYLTYLWEVVLPRLPGMTSHFPPTGGLPAGTIFIRRGWASFGWYVVMFPAWVYAILSVAMVGAIVLGIAAIVRQRRSVRPRWIEAVLLVVFPLAVFAGFELAFYTIGSRPVIGEMGRYEFPALVPLAILAVGALYAFGRRWLVPAGSMLLGILLVFCFASQLLAFTAFYA
jgi:4-amino-4-deoxy-L-arabinose transferase-like glycosyltransferase